MPQPQRPVALTREGARGRALHDTRLPSRTERLRARRLSRRLRARFYGLTLSSTLLPGSGLLGTRLRGLGVVITALAALIGGGLAAVLLSSGFSMAGVAKVLLSVAVRPTTLRVLLGSILVLAVVWVVAILLTAGQTRPKDGRGRLLRPLFISLCAILVAAPAAQAVRYLGIQASVVDNLTQANGGAKTIATGSAENPWAGVPRVNLLLIGSDAGPDRTGVRTDSLMVVSINTETGDAVLIGVPRNLENVPFPASNPLSTIWPNGYNCGDQCLMNAVWTEAENHPDLFQGEPNPGLRSTRDAVGEVLGLHIDRTVVIDLSGFQQLVDAMGGVEINVKERVCVACKNSPSGQIIWTSGKEIWIEPGLQRLDGYHALWYARSRGGSNDWSRMRRQRCVAGALVTQANPAGMLQRYPELASVIRTHLSIDLPQSELPAWVELVSRIQKTGTLRSLPITNDVTPPGRPDFDKIRSLVQLSFNPPPASQTPSPTAKPSRSPKPTQGGPQSPTPEPSSSGPSDDSLASLSATC